METTTLRDYLYSKMGYYDYEKTDKLCLKLSKSRVKIFDYPKETRVALYRFSILTITYLALGCKKEDFTIEGFFKLLHAEIADENFKSEKYTTFDCVIEDTLKKDSTLYFMNQYYQDYLEFMPDNAFEFYLEAWESITKHYGIDYDKAEIEGLWEQLNKKKEEKKEAKTEEQTDYFSIGDNTVVIRVTKALLDLSNYLECGESEDLDKARGIISLLPTDTEDREQLKDLMVELADFHEKHQPIYKTIEQTYSSRKAKDDTNERT